MASSVLIIAESGSGKSTSIESLNPEETFIINVANKPLPFKGWRSKYPLWTKETPRGRMIASADPVKIVACLNYISEKRPDIKDVVIDDFQYMTGFEYMEKAMTKGYEKFSSMAANLTKVATLPKDLRDDLTVYFLNHAEVSTDMDGNRKVKALTIGKMVDNVITLEGLFSIVLFCRVKKNKEGGGVRYVFETHNNGENTCKSPKSMFETDEIPNELLLVKNAISAYEN